MLVDAAWAAGANAWSLASFFLRVRAKAGPACGSCRDGAQACHPGLASADEERELCSDLELKAGHKPARGRKGAAHAYNIRSYREQERRFIEQAEAA
jgi:transposase